MKRNIDKIVLKNFINTLEDFDSDSSTNALLERIPEILTYGQCYNHYRSGQEFVNEYGLQNSIEMAENCYDEKWIEEKQKLLVNLDMALMYIAIAVEHGIITKAWLDAGLPLRWNRDKTDELVQEFKKIHFKDEMPKEQPVQKIVKREGRGTGSFRCVHCGDVLYGSYIYLTTEEDEEGFRWRSFCNECWEKLKPTSWQELYRKYSESELA